MEVEHNTMNRLSQSERAQVIAALVEGNSINSTVRMTGVSKVTILKLLKDVGMACAVGQIPERPETGYRIRHDRITTGLGQLTVTNGTDHDAAIRLVEANTLKSARFVYVRANDKSTINGIAPGSYTLLFSLGNDWIRACGKFLRVSDYQKFTNGLDFQQSDTKYSEFEVTLNRVPEGTAKTEPISEAEFLAGDEGPSVAP